MTVRKQEGLFTGRRVRLASLLLTTKINTMYTKEDTGTNVYLPEWGERPCEILEIMQNGAIYPVWVKPPTGKNVTFTAGGESHSSAIPTLSRTPYIQGEPFVCVVERPEPVWEPRPKSLVIVKNGARVLLVEEEVGGGVSNKWLCSDNEGYSTDELMPFTEDNAILAVHGLDQNGNDVNPYPNVQASGKIKIDTPEQSEAVQRVLFGMGYRWVINPNDQEAKHTDKPILAWRNQTITFASDADWNCIGLGGHIHHLTDFGIEQEPKPFGPEDNTKTIYDQDGKEWEFIVIATSKHFRAYLRSNECDTVQLFPDGSTATALVFTRTKPEQWNQYKSLVAYST